MEIYPREDYLKNPKPDSDGQCPFCDPDKIKESLIWEGDSWYIVYNAYPYIAGGLHIMTLPKKHLLLLSELSTKEASELPIVHREVQQFFGDQNYFSYCKETHNGVRTVQHYHQHFIAGILY